MFFSVRSWTLRARLRALPESTVSLKTSYFSRESTFRVASDFFEAGGVRYALINEHRRRRAGQKLNTAVIREWRALHVQ